MKLGEIRSRFQPPPEPAPAPVQLELALEVERVHCPMGNCPGYLRVYTTQAVYLGQLVYKVASPCFECEACGSIFEDGQRPGTLYKFRGIINPDAPMP